MDIRVVLLLVALAAFVSTVPTDPVTAGTDVPAIGTSVIAPTGAVAGETTKAAASVNTPLEITTPTALKTTPESKTTELPKTSQPITLHPTAVNPTNTPMTESGPTKSPTLKPTPAGLKGGFNAASFVGGIILGIAIVLIIGFSYSFYKTRRDKNYHTL